MLENVDRLIKSPSKQRGRDFAIILACLNEQGYSVEWRIINAAEYGLQQRRRRTFIFAFKNDTKYAKNHKLGAVDLINKEGFFARAFPVDGIEEKALKKVHLPEDIVKISDEFSYLFENSGYMTEGEVYTVKTHPVKKTPVPLGDILQQDADDKYYIPQERLYYTDEAVKYSDEMERDLPRESRQTWQYLKGGKND